MRTETDPARDGLLDETEAGNVAHVIVRGELLQLLFDDQSTNGRIDGSVNETLLNHRFDQLGAAGEGLGEKAGVPINDLS